MKLYGVAFSPFVMRVLLAAWAKGTELEVNGEGDARSEAFLAMTPTAKIPLLVDGDFALPESQVIVDYLDAVLPGPKLVPADAKGAARARLIVRLVDVYVVPALGGLFAARENPAGVAPAIAALTTAFGYVEHFRDAGDTMAVGDSFGVADAALIPIAFFLDAFAKLGTATILTANPGVAAWWERAKASELGARAVAEQSAGLKARFAKAA